MVYAENFNLEQYGESQLSAHDIYWVKRDGSRVLVRRAGEFLDQENLKRYPKLDFELKIDHQKISTIKEYFLSLKNGLRPKDKLRLSQKIRDRWEEIFFSDDSMTPLEIIILGDEIMCQVYSEFAKDWSTPSTILFQRSCLIASLSMMGAVSLGYTSWSYLENIWLVNFSYSAHYQNNNMKYSDLDLLEKNRSDEKIDVSEINLLPSKYVSLKAMMELVFEKSDGSGQPKHLNLNELSDLERWFNHLQQTIKWNSSLLQESGQVWKNLWSQDNFRVLEKLKNKNEASSQQSEQYIEFEL